MDKVIIFDIDGTIANCEHRLHYIKDQDPKDYTKFYMNCDKDEPIPAVLRVLKHYNDILEYDIIFVTGRSEICFDKTMKRIEEHAKMEFHQYELYMRDYGDHRPAAEIKKEALDLIERDIEAVFEDDPKCVQMYRNQGLFVFDVNHRKGDK